MKISSSLFVVVLSAFFLSGCSVFGANDEIEPAKLEKIDQQVELTPYLVD